MLNKNNNTQFCFLLRNYFCFFPTFCQKLFKSGSDSLLGGTKESKNSAAMQSKLTATGAEAESTASMLLPRTENAAAVSPDIEKNVRSSTADKAAVIGRETRKGRRGTRLSSVAAAT